MKKVLFVILAILAVALLAQAVFAQEFSPLTKGKKEVQLAATAVLSPSEAQSCMAIGSYGVFVSDPLEVGLQGGLFGQKGAKPSGLIWAFGTYHFLKETPSRTVPFAGIQVGSLIGGGGNNQVGFGANAGLKWFLSENKALVTQIQWMNVNKENLVELLVGISSFFD